MFGVTTWPDALPIKVEARFDGVNLTDISYALKRQTVRITSGFPNESPRAVPGTLSFELDNPVGDFTPTHPMSQYWPNVNLGIEIRASIFWDGAWHVRFDGPASEWRPSWPFGDLSDVNNSGEARVSLVASGILRHISQGKSPVLPAMERAVLADAPSYFWRLEDPEGSAVGSSSMPNGAGPPLGVSGSIGWRSIDSPPGGSSGTNAPAMNQGILIAEVTQPAPWTVEWSVQRRSDGGLDGYPIMQIQYLLNGVITPLSSTVALDAAVTDRDWYHYKVTAQQLGANYELRYWRNGIAQGVIPGHSGAGVLGSTVVFYAGNQAGGAPAFGMGYLAIYPHLAVDAQVHSNALQAFSGERAHERITRLCAEQNVDVTIIGTESQPMGPQQQSSFPELLAACVDVDMGLLYEQLDAPGLVYRCLRDMYNQTPALILDAALSEIANPFRPVADDQGVRNDVTVTRIGGIPQRVVLESGPKSILPPPGGVGTYDDGAGLVLNLESDTQAHHNARFRVFKGTWPGLRYPRISPAINVVADVGTAWLGVHIGDLVRVINLPPQHPANAVDVLVMGYTETITPTSWDVTINAAPAGPYMVGVYGPSTTDSRYDTEVSTLSVGAGSAGTTLSVATPAGHTLWVTGSAPSSPFPIDINISGVRLRVTGISGSSSPQTFTVQRSVDGFDKPLLAGAPVTLWTPGRYAL